MADGNGVRILLPGDDGYDDVGGARPPEGAGEFNDAIRSISQAANQEGGPTRRRRLRPERRGRAGVTGVMA